MADCDLCSVSLPTLNPVKVVMPRFASAFPKGTWVGLCDKCLESANAVGVRSAKRKSDKSGKCDLCGSKVELFRVDIERPSLRKSNGIEPDVANICKVCLDGCVDTKIRKDKEPKSEHH